jgi:monoterpene epsilon-lactone hydrolase
MTMTTGTDWLRVPERDVPIPASVSAVARATLQMPRRQFPRYPAASDREGWNRFVTNVNQGMLPWLQGRASKVDATVRTITVADVTIYDVRPTAVASNDRRVFLDIHGGAYIAGGGACCQAEAMGLADDLGMHVWSVDYRTPPDHPYPVPLEDCLTAYRALLKEHRPEDIVVGGTSAGGNLTAALILRARDESLPLPAAAVMHTPHLDMTNGSDSLYANQGLDAVLSGSDLTSLREVYAGGNDFRDPYISPLFGDLSKGFSPTFLSSGTRDLFLSDTVRMHAALRAVDVRAELHITEAASHGNFHGAPEEAHINREVRKFIASL